MRKFLNIILSVFILICIMMNLTACSNSNENVIINNLSRNYYYNQLDTGYKKYGKIFYNELYKNKDNMKNGKYKINIDNRHFSKDSKINDILSNDMKSINTSFLYAIIAFNIENPDVFWLDLEKLSCAVEGHFYMCAVDDNYFIDGINSESDVIRMEKEINESISNVMLELDKLNNDYDKIKKVHDFLCENIEYDDSSKNAHNIYGALVEKKCVCEGYAKAFQFFMNKLNIESTTIFGEGYKDVSINWNSNHAWNYVKLNGKWYAIDTTWDDNENEEIKYDFFLKGKETFEKNHNINIKGQFIDPLKNAFSNIADENFEYPDLNSKDYE